MRSITYVAVYQAPTYGYDSKITMQARTINSGFPKAVAFAVRDLPKGHELVSLTFWEAS